MQKKKKLHSCHNWLLVKNCQTPFAICKSKSGNSLYYILAQSHQPKLLVVGPLLLAELKIVPCPFLSLAKKTNHSTLIWTGCLGFATPNLEDWSNHCLQKYVYMLTIGISCEVERQRQKNEAKQDEYISSYQIFQLPNAKLGQMGSFLWIRSSLLIDTSIL